MWVREWTEPCCGMLCMHSFVCFYAYFVNIYALHSFIHSFIVIFIALQWVRHPRCHSMTVMPWHQTRMCMSAPSQMPFHDSNALQHSWHQTQRPASSCSVWYVCVCMYLCMYVCIIRYSGYLTWFVRNFVVVCNVFIHVFVNMRMIRDTQHPFMCKYAYLHRQVWCMVCLKQYIHIHICIYTHNTYM